MKNELLVPQLRCPLQSADGDVRLLGSGDAASVTYIQVDGTLLQKQQLVRHLGSFLANTATTFMLFTLVWCILVAVCENKLLLYVLVGTFNYIFTLFVS
jgi:hypothetical protein